MSKDNFLERKLWKFRITILYGKLLKWLNKWLPEFALYWIIGSVIAMCVYYTGPLRNITLIYHTELTFRWFAILVLFRVSYVLIKAVQFRKHGLEYSRPYWFDANMVTPVLKLVVNHVNAPQTVHYISDGLLYENFVKVQSETGTYLDEIKVASYEDIQLLNHFLTIEAQIKARALFDPEMKVG